MLLEPRETQVLIFIWSGKCINSVNRRVFSGSSGLVGYYAIRHVLNTEAKENYEMPVLL